MAIYNYRARDKFGKLSSGRMSAASEDELVGTLKKSELMPISIKESKAETGFGKILGRFKRMRLSDLNMFTRQFATLQKAGVTMLRILLTLKEQTTNNILKDALEGIRNDIKSGNTLSGALAKHKDIFGPLYTNMIAMGEESGTLDEVLKRLADLGEHEERVRMQIKSATRYPVLVVVAVIIAFLLLTVLVVPRFAKVYGAAGVSLPLPTLILIWTNYAITKFWWLVLILSGGFIYFLHRFINTPAGRFRWDTLKLKVPVFGKLMVRIFMSRFTRTCGVLMRSGIPILRILELASEGIGNVAISQEIDKIKIAVREGKGIAAPMKESRLFPPLVTQMIAVGEETGKIDELMLEVADYYDEQAEYMIANFTSLIEPMLLFFLACGVLLMALGIFLPMWNLMALFKGAAG